MSKTVFEMPITRHNLLHAVETVKGVALGKTSMPILGCIALTARAEGLSLRATNLDREVICPVVPVTTKGRGCWAVSAKRWAAAVKMAPTEEFTVKIDAAGLLSMEWVGGLCELPTLDGAEMPVPVVVSAVSTIEVAGTALRRLLEVGLSAASTDEMRYVLNGALLEAEGTRLKVVGTDGRRLAEAEDELASPVSGDVVSAVVPSALAEEIVAMIDDRMADMVTITVDRAAHVMQVGLDGGRVVSGKLIDGEYPDYKKVIPETKGQAHVVPLEGFLAACGRAQKFSPADVGAVTVELGGGGWTVEGTSLEEGRWREEVETQDHVPVVKVRLNPEYLKMLGEARGESAEFWAKDAKSPVRVLVPGTGADFVIMPMRSED